MRNALISAARSAYYATYEPAKLWWERKSEWLWKDNERPLVSIIIPTYNRCELLMTRALPSVMAQTYRNIEVIVAAHGCTDETAMNCYSGFENRGRLIEVPRTRTYPPTAENHWLAGPVVPANAALAACRGAWILRMDDDDILETDAIERLLRFAQSGNYEFVSAAHETHEGKVGPYLWDGAAVGGIQTSLYRSYLRYFKYNPDCWRKSWNRVNDIDLQHRMMEAGVRMGYLDEIVAKVLPRPGLTMVGSKAYLADVAGTERNMAFTA